MTLRTIMVAIIPVKVKVGLVPFRRDTEHAVHRSAWKGCSRMFISGWLGSQSVRKAKLSWVGLVSGRVLIARCGKPTTGGNDLMSEGGASQGDLQVVYNLH